MNVYKKQKDTKTELPNVMVEQAQNKQVYHQPKLVRYGRLSDAITYGYGIGNEVDSSFAV